MGNACLLTQKNKRGVPLFGLGECQKDHVFIYIFKNESMSRWLFPNIPVESSGVESSRVSNNYSFSLSQEFMSFVD